MKYEVLHTDGRAKRAQMETVHGTIQTPVFMNVGTVAAIKGAVSTDDLQEIGTQVQLSNTYHLHVRTGDELIKEFGGLHKFMHWDRNILTDSGGYQVYSFSSTRKIKEEGVRFKSHIDGSYHFFSPEKSMEIQRSIGADIIMAFDECTPYPCEYGYAKRSMHMTHRWLDRCIDYLGENAPKYGYNQSLFPIVQGSVYPDLRKISAEYIASKGADGNAIGGLSVGEPAEKMYEITEIVCDILPKDKPRYLMGVGTPINILENIALGVDMMDCVMPTRNARNGMLFTAHGTINIKNKKWENDFSPIDENGYTFVDTYYTKAYLRHLFAAEESLGKQIASIHNLGFYLWLVREARRHIMEGDFSHWKDQMVRQMNNRL